MTDTASRKKLIQSKIKETIDCIRNNKSLTANWENIEDYEKPIKKLCRELCSSSKLFCEKIQNTNNIIISSTDGRIQKTYNIICTDIVTFSGTIGVHEIEYDGGVNKHLSYLKLFTDQQAFPLLKNKLTPAPLRPVPANEIKITELYKTFYENLKEYFETYPLSMYSLMTGIKEVYNLPSDGIIISPNGYSFINFDNFKSIDLINRSHGFSYETSDTVPCLKIYYQGIKLMHLRTKIDYKSKKFRLRFFMETGKNFFRVFEDFSGDIKNEFN